MGMSNLEKYCPWATSHKSKLWVIYSLCFHLRKPGLLKDGSVPWDSLMSESWLQKRCNLQVNLDMNMQILVKHNWCIQLISQDGARGEIPVDTIVRDKFEDRSFILSGFFYLSFFSLSK